MCQKIFSYSKKGEVEVTLHLCDLKVAHDDLTSGVALLEVVVVLCRRACGAQSILGARANWWRKKIIRSSYAVYEFVDHLNSNLL